MFGSLESISCKGANQLQIFQKQFQHGIVEDAPWKVPQVPEHVVHYLPYQALQREGKDIRIIYDGSAKPKNELSINDCLEKGPFLIPNVVMILISFRNHAIVISADIEKAFLQVGLVEHDKDTVWFLWIADPKTKIEKQEIKVGQFARIPFGLIISPFILNITV